MTLREITVKPGVHIKAACPQITGEIKVYRRALPDEFPLSIFPRITVNYLFELLNRECAGFRFEELWSALRASLRTRVDPRIDDSKQNESRKFAKLDVDDCIFKISSKYLWWSIISSWVMLLHDAQPRWRGLTMMRGRIARRNHEESE